MSSQRDGNTQGERIRALFVESVGEVVIVAPFIKVAAFESLLSVVPADTTVRCVTRWLPRDIAAGVSDPEIIGLLEDRGKYTLTLVDKLHAKLYLAEGECLVGSANVTLAGFGESADMGNVEVLVRTTAQDPGVVETLQMIEELERPASLALAKTARRLAEILSSKPIDMVMEAGSWFPRSRQPEEAFDFYEHPPEGFMGAAADLLISDVASLNFQPGMARKQFDDELRRQLGKIHLAKMILESEEDRTYPLAEVRSHLDGWVDQQFLLHDVWRAFVSWMIFFFPNLLIEQEITEIALRRARGLQ